MWQLWYTMDYGAPRHCKGYNGIPWDAAPSGMVPARIVWHSRSTQPGTPKWLCLDMGPKRCCFFPGKWSWNMKFMGTLFSNKHKIDSLHGSYCTFMIYQWDINDISWYKSRIYNHVFRLFWGCTAYLEEHAANSCWWIKWVLCPTFYFDNQVNMCLLFTTKSCSYHGCLLFVESRAHCFLDLWGIWIGMNHSFTEPFPSTFADVWWQPKGAAGSLPIRSAMAMKKKGESIHWAAQNQLGLSENCVLKNLRVLLHVFALKLPKNWSILAFGQTQGWLIVCSQGLRRLPHATRITEWMNGWIRGGTSSSFS